MYQTYREGDCFSVEFHDRWDEACAVAGAKAQAQGGVWVAWETRNNAFGRRVRRFGEAA